MPAAAPIRIAITSLAGLAIGFAAMRGLGRESTPHETSPPPALSEPHPPDRPWLASWIAGQASLLTTGGMPDVPPHMVPDPTEAHIAQLAHESIPAAMTAIAEIADDEKQQRDLIERLILDPLLRADPIAALEIARSWKDYTGSDSSDQSYLFYDVPAGKYPELAHALLAEPPGQFRDAELPHFFFMWARCAPAAASVWISRNLPPEDPAFTQLSAIANAALACSGEIPATLSKQLATVPVELRTQLFRQLFTSALDAPDISRRADEILTAIPEADLADATADFALGWSRYAPEPAATWALALPDATSRNASLDAVARSWQASDPDAAATWLHTLPPLQSSIALPIFARHLKPTDDIPE